MMNNWQKKLNQMQQQGRIRGYHVAEKRKGFSAGNAVIRGKNDSKALDWLGWNLLYWANEHAMTLAREYQFSAERKFLSDWAIPAIKTLIEYEGGIFMRRGGHNSPTGIQRDIDKYSLAQKEGWRIIRLTSLNYTTVLSQLNELIK